MVLKLLVSIDLILINFENNEGFSKITLLLLTILISKMQIDIKFL